jgi:hypothetical protein
MSWYEKLGLIGLAVLAGKGLYWEFFSKRTR